MKKILIPVAVVALGAAAYLGQQQTSTYNVLDYVPADTPLFTGQLSPFPIKDYIASNPSLITPADQERIIAMQEATGENAPAIHFLANLMETYQAGLTDADLLVKTFGLADNVRAYFYTLGLLPVFKIEVANPQAIWDLLDQNEVETGFAHSEGKLQDLTFRTYPLSQPGDSTKIDLVVAQSEGLLTITLKTDLVSDTLLASALGLSKADKSLADSKMLDNIIQQHKFTDASVGFINHVEIIKGLTTTDGNQLAKQFSAIVKQEGDNPFEMLQTPVCQAEMTAIVQNWPRTVFGYTSLNINKEESTLGFASVVETKNQVILDALKSMRGYIPNYTQNYDNNVVATSIGLDVAKLASSLTSIWSDLQTPTFQCAPLASIQSDISQSGESLAMLGMGANMAAGVKGISTAIFDYSLSQINDEPQLDSFDALVAIHAESPDTIFNSIKMFSPEFQNVQLTNGGPAVSLNDIFPMGADFNLDPKLAIKGQHLVIYNGAKGQQEAEKLGLEKLQANGIYQVSFDSKKLLSPILNAAELAGEIIPEEAMFLTEYDTRMNVKLDINDQGIRLDSTVNNKSAKTQ